MCDGQHYLLFFAHFPLSVKTKQNTSSFLMTFHLWFKVVIFDEVLSSIIDVARGGVVGVTSKKSWHLLCLEA